MTNTKLLKSAIQRSGYKTGYIIEKLGISYQCFLNKINNRSEFKARELQILRELLNLRDEEWEEIFFANKVE